MSSYSDSSRNVFSVERSVFIQEHNFSYAHSGGVKKCMWQIISQPRKEAYFKKMMRILLFGTMKEKSCHTTAFLKTICFVANLQLLLILDKLRILGLYLFHIFFELYDSVSVHSASVQLHYNNNKEYSNICIMMNEHIFRFDGNRLLP